MGLLGTRNDGLSLDKPTENLKHPHPRSEDPVRAEALLATFLLLGLAGCGAPQETAESDRGPDGPCKRLFIAHSDAQALILGSYAKSARSPPPITTATAEARAGERVLQSDSLDHDGCVRLPLVKEPAEYTFFIKNQDASGCRWSAGKTVYYEGSGVLEMELKLATICT